MSSVSFCEEIIVFSLFSCLYFTISFVFAFTFAHSDNDIIHVDPSNPTQYRGFQCVSFEKVIKLNDGKEHNVTQLEIVFESVDYRDFNEVYNEHWPRVVCGGAALLAYVPTSGRHAIDDRPDNLTQKASAGDNRATKFRAARSGVLKEGKGCLCRPVLFDFGGMICSGDLTSKDVPNKDQPIKFYIDPTPGQVYCGTRKKTTNSIENVGWVRLNIVSAGAQELELDEKLEHSIEDATKGCD